MRRTLLALLTLVCCLALAAPAVAASPGQLYDDCQDNGRIDGTYSQGDYQRALRQLPSDLDEYTDCRDVIRRGQLRAAAARKSGSGGSNGAATTGGGGGGATGSGGGGTAGRSATGSATTGAETTTGSAGTGTREPIATATGQERQAYTAAATAGAAPVELDGRTITPGAAGVQRLAGDGHALPAPVLILLILVAVAVVAGGSSIAWSRVRARGAR